MVPNAPIASYMGKKYNSKIMGTLGVHGGQVKRKIEEMHLVHLEISCISHVLHIFLDTYIH